MSDKFQFYGESKMKQRIFDGKTAVITGRAHGETLYLTRQPASRVAQALQRKQGDKTLQMRRMMSGGI